MPPAARPLLPGAGPRDRGGGALDRAWSWTSDIKDAFEPLHRELDHRYLNEVEGLDNPTSENLARWIWERLENELPLSRVVLSETCTSGVEYRGRDCR